MASPTVSEDPAVQTHYAAQVALSATFIQAMKRAWPLVNLRDLKGSLPQYRQAVNALVQHFGPASAALSADYFDTMRLDAGITSPFRTPIVDPPPVAQVDASIGWATNDLWTIATETEVSVVEAAQVKAEGAAQKIVTDQGRNELIAAIEADKEARGFARVTKPGACAFCTMLATRGAVYADRNTFASSNARFEGSGLVKVHNGCSCTFVPLFGRHYEPPAHVREAQAIYNEATAGEPDKLNAFRRAWEAHLRTLAAV